MQRKTTRDETRMVRKLFGMALPACVLAGPDPDVRVLVLAGAFVLR